MNGVILIVLLMFQPANKELLIDFGSDKDGNDWEIVNDGVMGGLSEGRAILKENSVLFKGRLSLENNGGFSSFRGPLGSYNLSKYSTVEIRYRSDGRDFEMTMAKSKRFYRTNYKYAFTESGEDWQVVRFKLKDFKAYVMGRPKNETIPEDVLDDIIRLGFILSDKKVGSFEIEVDYIRFF